MLLACLADGVGTDGFCLVSKVYWFMHRLRSLPDFNLVCFGRDNVYDKNHAVSYFINHDIVDTDLFVKNIS